MNKAEPAESGVPFNGRAGKSGSYLADHRSHAANPSPNNFITKNRSAGKVSQNKVIQRMTRSQAIRAKQDERLVWYKQDGQYSEVRITNDLIAEDTHAAIRKMDGSSDYVPLAALHLVNPFQDHPPQVGISGASTPGLSKPIPGENMIHRGIVETEMIGDVPHVRVYSALMGSAPFDTEDPATGEATSRFKDIHQSADGSIMISTGQNSVLWGNMGRPLRTVKWSEKYFAQLIEEKPELKPDYERYMLAINDLDNSGAILSRLESEIVPLKADLKGKTQRWIAKGKKTTKRQLASIGLVQKKVHKKQQLINSEKLSMNGNKKTIEAIRTKLAKSANPIIRSFLIPFASFKKISEGALPERLHGVVPKVEKLAPIVDQGKVALDRMKFFLNAIATGNQKAAKLKKEIERLGRLKSQTKRQGKRLALRNKKLMDAQASIQKNKLSIVAEFHKFESATNVDPAERSKESNHTKLHEQLKEKYTAAFAEVKKLKDRAMPDLAMQDFTAAGVLAEMKNRKLDKGSINVDVHYEPNQFGLHGDDIETLRKDAVKGSLESFAMFPDKLSKKQRRESGKLQSVDVLRERLGIPVTELAENPWLSGSGFAKKNKFEKSAKELSEYYATWLKMKKPEFDDSAMVEPDRAGIPFERRKEMLLEFLEKHHIAPERRDEFMEKVVAPWASQGMIAHIMASDFDAMNNQPSLKKEVPHQDFEEMRAKLPLERGGG